MIMINNIDHLQMSVPSIGSYLELSQAESSSGADLAVVLDGWAADDWPQLVDWARSDLSSLCLTSITARLLLAGLEFENRQDRAFAYRRHSPH